MKWVPRSQWGARKPRSVTPLTSPGGLTYHYVAGSKMGTFSHATCATRVRNIQNFHMDTRRWADIAYNVVTCPHGYVYEGRGWGRRSAANGTDTGNGSSYANCHLMGVGDVLTTEGKQAMRDALVASRTIGGAGPRIWVHNDWKSTGCPGDEVTRFVRSELTAPPPPIEEDELSAQAEAWIKDMHEWLSKEFPAIRTRLDKLEAEVASVKDTGWRARVELNKGRREQEAQAADLKAELARLHGEAPDG